LRRLACALCVLLPAVVSAEERQPAWVAANFVGDPPAALMRSREGWLRWTGLWGTRRLQHASLVSRVAVSPDGKWIASACWDGTVKLWDATTGKEIRTFDMGQTVLGLAISPDARRIYASDDRGEVRAWDVSTGGVLKSWQLHTELWGIVLSPDGKLLAWWSKDGFNVCDAFTFDFASREFLKAGGWNEPIYRLVFTPDGSRVVTRGSDNLVRVWEIATGAMTSLAGPDGEPLNGAVAVDPKGEEVAASCDQGHIARWKLRDGTPLPTLEDEGQVEDIAFSPDGKLVATVAGWIRLRARATGQVVHELEHDSVSSIAFAPDGTWLASGGEDGSVRIWDVSTGAQRLGEERLPDVPDLAVSEDGTWAVTALGAEARVWDTATGAPRRRFTRGDDSVDSVQITPDGKVQSLCTKVVETKQGGLWGQRYTVMWDPTTGQTLRTSDKERAAPELPAAIRQAKDIGAITISPDGSKIAGAGEDDTVRLWDKDGRELNVLRGHADQVKCVAWSEDGRWIFSGGQDGFVRVWDAASGKEADLLPVDGQPVVLVHRKDRLYVGCWNHTVCVYAWTPPR